MTPSIDPKTRSDLPDTALTAKQMTALDPEQAAVPAFEAMMGSRRVADPCSLGVAAVFILKTSGENKNFVAALGFSGWDGRAGGKLF